jgi:hypothetical protein
MPALRYRPRVVAVAFPSLEFFQTLQREVAAERERFSRLGYFDTTFGIRILQDGGAAEFTVAFEVFDCVRVVDGIEPEGDFVIEGPLAAWKEMLDNVHALGAADTEHSLNTLTHFGERLTVRYDDPTGTTSSTASRRACRSGSTSPPAWISGILTVRRRRRGATSLGGWRNELSQHDGLRRRSCLRRPLQAQHEGRPRPVVDEGRARASQRAGRLNERRGLTFRDLDVDGYGFSEMPS